jgi:hypothetical protein
MPGTAHRASSPRGSIPDTGGEGIGHHATDIVSDDVNVFLMQVFHQWALVPRLPDLPDHADLLMHLAQAAMLRGASPMLRLSGAE